MKKSCLCIIALLLLGCGDSDSFNNEITFTGLNVEANDFGGGVDADNFRISVRIQSQNTFAQEYGINPKILDPLTDLKVVTYQEVTNFAEKDMDLSKFFLVDDHNSRLFRSIPDYIQTEKRSAINVELVFTNQEMLTSGSPKLIKDTVTAYLAIITEFESGKRYTDSLSIALIP